MPTEPTIVEEVLGFACDGERLWGIVARPAPGRSVSPTAVLVVVGGPQYRVGSHRQFVSLARRLADAGHVVLRFDYRGMGDSDGALRDFEQAGPDVAAALDALQSAAPAARRLVVWGLCDAASAALMFAAADPRVAGIVAANPWVRSEATLAAARVKHYYGARLRERAFWLKLLRGGFDWLGSLRSFAANLRAGFARRSAPAAQDESFQARMLRGAGALRGRLLLLLSGHDITAQEFVDRVASEAAWQARLAAPNVTRIDLPDADHTFSRRDWQRSAEDHTIAWLAEADRAGTT